MEKELIVLSYLVIYLVLLVGGIMFMGDDELF